MKIISRKDALTLGRKRYFTGRKCKRGHIAEHHIKGSCVECVNLRETGRRDENRQRSRIYRYRYQKLEVHPTPTRAEPEKCEICGDPPGGRYKWLCLDHDHVTGKFRGWLCFKCNTAIGKLGDTAQGVANALAYLLRNS